MNIDVSPAKLSGLLAAGAEHAGLDYKTTVDLDAKEVVELYKDIGAMMDHGGYIVIGADDSGVPAGGLIPGQERLLDEATLRPRLEKYIPKPFAVVTKVHQLAGVTMGLIQVLPHEHGVCTFLREGSYPDPKNPKNQIVVFRANEMFTRHGTSSERVDGLDLQRIRQKPTAAGPVRPGVAMDDPSFRTAVADAFGRSDKIGIIDALDALARATEEAAAASDVAAMINALDKLTAVATLAMKYRESAWVSEVIDRLQIVYEFGFLGAVAIPGGAARLWLDVTTRVMGIGAVAVAMGHYDLLRQLTLRSPNGMDKVTYTNWITHTAIQTARAGFLKAKFTGLSGETTFLRAVEIELGSVTGITDFVPNQGELQKRLAQFDVLAAVTVWGRFRGKDEYPYWASYAGYYQDRYEPALVRLVQDARLRELLFGGTDEDLREVLRILEEQARKNFASFGGGGGLYVAPEIHRFLAGRGDG